jgi:hypothetical protein
MVKKDAVEHIWQDLKEVPNDYECIFRSLATIDGEESNLDDLKDTVR